MPHWLQSVYERIHIKSTRLAADVGLGVLVFSVLSKIGRSTIINLASAGDDGPQTMKITPGCTVAVQCTVESGSLCHPLNVWAFERVIHVSLLAV